MSRAKEIAFQLSRQASGINPSAPEYTGPPEHWTEAVTRLEAENAVQAEEIARLREVAQNCGEVLDNVRCHLGICGPGDDGERKADAPDNWGILSALDDCRAALKSSAK